MASQSRLETLPSEILNHILRYLIVPRSRLPGLSERLSDWTSDPDEKKAAVDAYLGASGSPPDTERFAQNLFAWDDVRHPFNVLALTSSRLYTLVETFCAHLVRTANIPFNLPFAQAERSGPESVYPQLSNIVYRRLWLQCAPRTCVFCGRPVVKYPNLAKVSLILACAECFYAQTLTIFEVESHFHLSRMDLEEHSIPECDWFLRTDIEALALAIYGTRRFHDIRVTPPKLCHICLKAGTLARAVRSVSKEVLPGWTKHSSGWILEPEPGSENAMLTRGIRWPKLSQYPFDELHYEQRIETSAAGATFSTYIGHHLIHENLSDKDHED